MPYRQGKHRRVSQPGAANIAQASGTQSRPLAGPALLLTLALIASCTSQPSLRSIRDAHQRRDFGIDDGSGNSPRELLDENSGSTLIVVRRPIVLARSRTDLAANVRDYVTLVVTQEDRAGKYSTWLIVHRWSTVDARIDSMRALASGNVLLIADGRSVSLAPVDHPPSFANRGDLLYAPPTKVNSWVYQADLPTLRYIAAARDLSLRFVDDGYPIAYGIWQDARRELQELLDSAVAPQVRPH